MAVVHGQHRKSPTRRTRPYGLSFVFFFFLVVIDSIFQGERILWAALFFFFQGNVAFETGPTLIANLFRQIYSSVFAKQAQNIMYVCMKKKNVRV